MPIDKQEFLQFAKSLPEDTEIQIRNAVSRAYYSAYHACLEVYKMDNSAEGGVHSKLITSLTKSSDVKDRKIGFILNQLKGLRTVADYHLSKTVSAQDKALSIKQTETLIKELS
ncbi:MAG: hypothetical protein CTY16_11105 [Methylobacter sp.]|nr:MAG: hypothetical protein CTY16_11105 [Methylobacter sp.]